MIRTCNNGVLIWVDYNKELAQSGLYELCFCESCELIHDLFMDIITEFVGCFVKNNKK